MVKSVFAPLMTVPFGAPFRWRTCPLADIRFSRGAIDRCRARSAAVAAHGLQHRAIFEKAAAKRKFRY
jgi:hypothetical protein